MVLERLDLRSQWTLGLVVVDRMSALVIGRLAQLLRPCVGVGLAL